MRINLAIICNINFDSVCWLILLLYCYIIVYYGIVDVICSWLQPDRAVDPGASELVVPSEPIRTGTSSSFTIHTKDQDKKLVYVEGMKVIHFESLDVMC